MKSSFRTIILLLFLFFYCPTVQSQSAQFEVYVTSQQVTSLLGDELKREAALRGFNELGISKLYLETIRGGTVPDETTLIAVRDFFQQHGYEIAGSVATIRGSDFGMSSNQQGIWLNYQNPKTQTDMANHFRWIASLFDEIMIDDFFATDDMSEESIAAKGNRSWSQYRLALMTDFAKQYVIKPARESNPDVQLILKFPQWYDRFHKFGYNVETAPELFDRIWVGTETRNPETKRFGFTMPTMGFINYSWLKSFAGGKIGGGWFDFGDCTPESFLMQAYQTVLAGGHEMVLFQAGSVLQPDPCIEPFRNRQQAISQLSAIIANQRLLGSLAYKPPHSDGSDVNHGANLYAYDYFATLGLSPVMSGNPNTDFGTVLLSRQAADDPEIVEHIHRWLDQNKTLVMTPDFISATNSDELVELAGYASPFELGSKIAAVSQIQIGQEVFDAVNDTIEFRHIPKPEKAEILVSGQGKDGKISFLSKRVLDRGKILVLNLATFTHEEFAPGKEQFLPPRPLSIKDLPDTVVQQIHKEISYPYGIEVEGNNNLGLYFYDNNTVVLANFTSHLKTANINFPGNKQVNLHESFQHGSASHCIMKTNAGDSTHYEINIPAWEITVLSWK